MNIKDKNIDILLKGGHLLKEISPNNELDRTWIEVSIDKTSLPEYPLRLPPYAMLQGSKYMPKSELQSAVFRMRKSSFPAEDIAMQFDPPYERVGEYQNYTNLNDLILALRKEGLNFDDLADASLDDEYPL